MSFKPMISFADLFTSAPTLTTICSCTLIEYFFIMYFILQHQVFYHPSHPIDLISNHTTLLLEV